MKKLIILGVVGLFVGVGGGTGIAIALRPAVVADSTKADSAAAHGDSTAIIAPAASHATAQQAADSTAQDSTTHDSTTTAPAVHGTPAKADSAPAHADASPVESTVADSVQRAQVRRIARIFAAMAPREAAKVLQQLNDEDVSVIVASLNEKQAAAILMAFPPERAATISRGQLRTAQGQKP
jgi:hypothetical protein